MLPGSIPDDIYRLFIETVEDYALFLIDRDGCVASWNPGAERIKGWREEEIVGRHYRILSTAEQREAGQPERELCLAARDGVFSEEGWRSRRGDVSRTPRRRCPGRLGTGVGHHRRRPSRRMWGSRPRRPVATAPVAAGRERD